MSPYVCHLTHKLHACKRPVCVYGCVFVCVPLFARNARLCFFQTPLLTCSSFIFYVVLFLCFHFWNLLGCFCRLVTNMNSTVAIVLNSFTNTHAGQCLWMQLIYMLNVQLLAVRCLVWWEKKKIHVRSPAANFVVIHVLKFVSPAATNIKQYPKVTNNPSIHPFSSFSGANNARNT